MLEREAVGGLQGHTPASPVLDRLGWYLNRLRCMTPAELTHRVLRAARVRAEHLQLSRLAASPPAQLSSVAIPWVQVPPEPDVAACIAAADRVAEGRYDIFALKGIELGMPPRWNVDPKTGVEAPLRFGKLLNYRDSRLVGDIKYLWELNRHAHLVTLAQAHAVSGERRYFELLQQHLESWIAACPCPYGPNWSSALEPALRLISWSTAWQLLGRGVSPDRVDAANTRFRARWLESVFQHARFVQGYFSLHSSANNHLVGEAAGLYVAAVTWPHWPQARVWRRTAKAILERETLLQNAPDGVNLEQAIAYQRFELELLMLCWLAGAANGEMFSEPFRLRIEAMLEYVASTMDFNGNVPMIGDSDDAIVLRLDHRPDFCAYRSLLATGAVLFRRHDFRRKAAGLDERTRWLVPDAGSAFHALDASRAQLPVRQRFPEGGYYILGCEFETPNEIRLVADAGPLGYQTIAAHGHADALAFTLSVGGMEFLIDPGTYAYHTQERWRRYFRGTAAHNTVRVDGRDQSHSGGNFMWVKKARARCSSWSSDAVRDVLEGWHDGYLSLSDPVIHRRRIVLDKRTRRVLVEDTLEMNGSHTIELLFHCDERCRAEEIPPGFVLTRGSRTLELKLPQMDGAERRTFHGSVSPILGWVSRRYDEKEAATTLMWRCRTVGNAVLRTEITC